jgi:hypothetical protein
MILVGHPAFLIARGFNVGTQAVLFIIGAVCIAVGVVGGGTFFQSTIPTLPIWARTLVSIIGVMIFAVAFFPRLYTDLPSSSATNPPVNAGSESPSTSSSGPLKLAVRCTIDRSQLRAGVTMQLTYTINSTRQINVGLGAGVYDQTGNDHSTGFGDIDSIPLTPGRNVKERPLQIPGSLPPGRYEVDAEIWPPNKVGADGSNTLADGTCGYFNVP